MDDQWRLARGFVCFGKRQWGFFPADLSGLWRASTACIASLQSNRTTRKDWIISDSCHPHHPMRKADCPRPGPKSLLRKLKAFPGVSQQAEGSTKTCLLCLPPGVTRAGAGAARAGGAGRAGSPGGGSMASASRQPGKGPARPGDPRRRSCLQRDRRCVPAAWGLFCNQFHPLPPGQLLPVRGREDVKDVFVHNPVPLSFGENRGWAFRFARWGVSDRVHQKKMGWQRLKVIHRINSL